MQLKLNEPFDRGGFGAQELHAEFKRPFGGGLGGEVRCVHGLPQKQIHY